MPEEAPAVQFTRFVSSVDGRLVARWDAPGSCFGARVSTLEERTGGAAPIQWDTACVVPLTAPFCAKYDRELRNALRGGDLLERTREDWQAWLKTEEAKEDEHVARLKATTATSLAAPESSPEQTTPPSEAEPKPGRKKST